MPRSATPAPTSSRPPEDPATAVRIPIARTRAETYQPGAEAKRALRALPSPRGKSPHPLYAEGVPHPAGYHQSRAPKSSISCDSTRSVASPNPARPMNSRAASSFRLRGERTRSRRPISWGRKMRQGDCSRSRGTIDCGHIQAPGLAKTPTNHMYTYRPVVYPLTEEVSV